MTTIQLELDEIKKIKSQFFIDIWASNVSNESQSEILLEYGWSGIMFECDPKKYPIQKEKMKDKNVLVLSNKITPINILNLLEENNVPDGFYLSLDIDGYDFYVLEQILTKYKPEFIISEINEKIPPPIKFSVNFNEDYFWDGTHYYGYSISMLENILEKYGYKIKRLDFNNVILIPGIQTENISEVYNNGYLHRPERQHIFSYNYDFENIYGMLKEEQISFINNKFSQYSGNQIDGKEIIHRDYTLL